MAILASSLSYGAAHGCKNIKQFFGCIISSLIFTVSYVITMNIWWLMIIHSGIMIVGFLSINSSRNNNKIK